jgi:hypothetical protein
MTTRTRILTLAAVLAALTSRISGAQSLATYGSAEAAGHGEGSLFLGSTLSAGGPGISPFVSAYVQTYRYRSGPGTYANATAFAPAVGLSYGTPVGAVSASLGYNFISSSTSNVGFIGLQGGNEGSAFTTLQGNYWGDGDEAVQGIVSYSFRSQYVWSRLRAGHRVGTSPVFLGGEAVWQGTSNGRIPGTTLTYSAHRYQFGPTIEYRFTPEFRLGGAAGYKGGDNNYPGTGYVSVNFLWLNSLAGR